ncbi:phosphate acyltransferase PlsX [Cytophagaceae bacterium ABcell3]|nr:phosphate acyltransferase PlsX [Cytophagaceae bacterium ABcell3]
MNIALDAMGGDLAPKAVIEGALLARDLIPSETNIVLIGRESDILKEIAECGGSPEYFTIVHSDDIIEMGEHPTKAFQQKPNASIAIGFGMLKSRKADVFCSAGNTGAMMVGSLFTVKAIPGIMRPGIAGLIPKERGEYGVILDVGANAECKPEVLDQFAVLGSIYAQNVMNIENPKVALMNLGEEEQKGSVITQAAHQLMKANKKINFVGNVEGRDLFNEKADVIVCDGFNGNVILKMAESFYDLMSKRNITSPFIELFNYATVGGSPILGVDGNVIIAHGCSDPMAIKNMILQAVKLAEADITSKIKQAYC